jgi:hypothetical protein
VIPTTMSLDNLLNKPVRFGPVPKAKAKKISQLGHNSSLGRTLLDIYSCYRRAKHWDKLPHAKRILLELRWTELMLELLGIGNSTVMHSLRYKLREETPEEDEEVPGFV